MDWTQIVLIVFIGLLIIAYPILISSRNKKENQKLQEQTNSLKRGDKVLTTSGVYGTIVDLQMENDKKVVTIETGSGNHKSYMAVDAYAIYTIFRDDEKKSEPATEKAKLEQKPEKNDKKPQKNVKNDQKPAQNDQNEQTSDAQTQPEKSQNDDKPKQEKDDKNDKKKKA